MTVYRLLVETADGGELLDVMPAENARRACYEAAADHPGWVTVTATSTTDPDDTWTMEAGVWW